MKNSAGSRVSATRTIPDGEATMSSTCLDCVTTNSSSSRDPICRSTCRTVALLGRVEAVATEAVTASATSTRSIWSRSSSLAKWPPIWPSGPSRSCPMSGRRVPAKRIPDSSDLVARSAEDINSSALIRRTNSAALLLDHIRSPSEQQMMNGPDGENLNRSSSSFNNKTTTHSPLMDNVESSRKRTKSERRSEHEGSSGHPPTGTHPHSERIKYKAEIPISVILRAAQAKTQR